ncbi:MAG: hypothetical protein DRJ13_12615, partial [Bacteroidetes bacterium]
HPAIIQRLSTELNITRLTIKPQQMLIIDELETAMNEKESRINRLFGKLWFPYPTQIKIFMHLSGMRCFWRLFPLLLMSIPFFLHLY